MKQLPAYQKRRLLEKVLKDDASVSLVCRQNGISRKTFYQWKKRYLAAGPRCKSTSLEKHPLRGLQHPRGKRALFQNEVLKIIVAHPEWGSHKISQILLTRGKKLGNHAVYSLIKELGLEKEGKRQEFAGLHRTLSQVRDRFAPGPRRLLNQARKRMVEEVLLQGRKIGEVSREFKVSRKTVWKWICRYRQAQESQAVLLTALSDQHPRASRHFRGTPNWLEKRILDAVAAHPEYSTHTLAQFFSGQIGNHGIQNILSRNGLSIYQQRLIFSKAQTPATIVRPATGWTSRLKTVFATFIPQLAPAPPPVLFQTFRSLLLPFTLPFLFGFSFFFWTRMLLSQPPSSQLGLVFASISLIFGTFFFLYSLKYYFTLILILGFSRQVSGEGNGNGSSSDETSSWSLEGAIGSKGDSIASLQNDSNNRKGGFWQKIFGIANGGNNGFLRGRSGEAGSSTEVEPPLGSGLQPDISQVKLNRRPHVSIHLALYNEKRVVERLLTACTAMDYENYEVVVVDDSTDETIEILQKWRSHPKVKVIHRESREGYKGGALQVALQNSDPKTEFIIVFDADFLPYPDTITQFLKYFQVTAGGLDFRKASSRQPLASRGEQLATSHQPLAASNSQLDANQLAASGSPIAAVQGYQWHVLNKSENWITRGVRSEYAGSYIVERPGGEILGALKQIAGSVYMIRKDILDRYNWGTSITEDFELTLRLYRDGYKVVYTPYIQTPSECVSTLKRLIRQRMRWAEGHSHNIRKMFGQLMWGRWEQSATSHQPLAASNSQLEASSLAASGSKTWVPSKLTLTEKLEFLYLSPYYLQAAFFLVGTLSWFISEAIFQVRLPFWTSLWGWSLVFTNLFALPLMNTVGLFLEESEERDYLGILSFISLAYILVPFQGYAAAKGFLEKNEGPWFRTPKTGKITDILAPGRFARFISGIFGRPATAPAAVQSFTPWSRHGGTLRGYLTLAPSTIRYGAGTANNRFENFRIKPKRIKWIGRTFLVSLLLFSTTILSLAPAAPYFIEPKQVKAQEFGMLTPTPTSPEVTPTPTVTPSLKSPTITPSETPTPTLVPTPAPVSAPGPTLPTVPFKNLSLTRHDFKAGEEVKVNLGSEEASSFEISVKDSGENEVEFSLSDGKAGDDNFLNIAHGVSFRPGKYTLKIIRKATGEETVKDFTWGVLAINTNKSIYLPNEEAYIQMAALKDDGHTICDAPLELKVTSPGGVISKPNVQKSGECGPDNVTDVPDYFAYYWPREIGVYQIKLVNNSNQYSIDDSFEVRESVPFSIERIGPTRIYPYVPYEMKLKVIAYQKVKGYLSETIPSEFVVLDNVRQSGQGKEKVLSWPIDWETGESQEFTYRFDAPDVSPEFYLLGPGQVIEGGGREVFRERRQWQIAADQIAGDARVTYADSTVASPDKIRTRRYERTPNSWTTEASMGQSSGTAIRFVVEEASPTRNEHLVGIWEQDGSTGSTLRILRYNGVSWSAEWTTTTASNTLGIYTRPFDIAYEKSSGDAVVVYSTGAATTNELAYRVWNGTSWTAAANYNVVGTTALACGIELESRSASDRIGMIYTVDATTNSVNTAVWNGSSWESNPSSPLETGVLEPGTACRSKAYDVAWEETSGEILAAWGHNGTSNTWSYSACTGGPPCTWAAKSTGGTEEGTVLDMATQAGTNNIGISVLSNNGNDMGGGYWNGSSWSSTGTPDAGAADPDVTLGQRSVGVGWLTSGATTKGVLIYADAAFAGVDYTLVESGVVNLTETQCGTMPSGLDEQTRVVQDPSDASKFLVLIENGNSDLWATRFTFDGTTVTCADTNGGSALNANMPYATSQPFDFAYEITGNTQYNQAAYRWFENNNGTSVVTPLADQDMAINVPAQGTGFRLRGLLDVSQAGLGATSQSFNLQYAVKSGRCDSDFVDESYSDVSDTSGNIRFNNNATPNDGDTVTQNATYDPTYLGHTNVMERYEEVNPTNNVNAIPNGQAGLWDFSLVNYSAPAGTSYCFRVRKDSSYAADPKTVKAVNGLGTAAGLNYGTWDGTSYWIGNYNDQTIHKISPAGTILNTYTLASDIRPIEVAWDGTYIWVASADTYGKLVQFNPSTGLTVATYTKNPSGLGTGGTQGVIYDSTNNRLWIGVAQNGGGAGSGLVIKLDPADAGTNLCTASNITNAGGLGHYGDYIWATGQANVYKIAKVDCSVTGTYAQSLPTRVALDSTYAYISNFNSNDVTKRLQSDGSVSGTYPTCVQPNVIRLDGAGNFWTACDDGQVKVHASTGAVLGSLIPGATGNNMNGLTFDGSYMWGANYDTSHAYKMNTGQMLDTYTKVPEIGPTSIEEYAYHWSNDDGGENHWYNSSWNYRKKITIQKSKVSSSLTDFPILISLATDSSLVSYAKSDGYDILFASASQVKIPYERETYNNSTGQLVAWVKVPSLSSGGDTNIYMYYGNAGAFDQQDAANVWDNNYKMIQHLTDLTTSTTNDSKNNNDGTKYLANEPLQTTDAKIWRAQSFDGTNDFINTGNDTTLQISSAITVEGWFKSSVANDNWDKVASKGDAVWSLEAKDDSGKHGFTVYDTNWRTGRAGTYTQSAWTYLVGTYSTSDKTIRAYVNGDVGAETTTATQITNYNTANLYIGSIPTGGNYVNGIIDEVRVSSIVRDANWIKTSYNTMNDPASFYSLGTEESRVSISPAYWKDAENTAVINQTRGVNIRARFTLSNTGGLANYNYRLQVAAKGAAASCEAVNTGNFSDVPTTSGAGCGSAVACMTTSSNFLDGAATTNQSFAPGAFSAGKMIEDPSNQTSSLALNGDYYTEVEHNFQLTSYAASSTTYCFRQSNAGSATNFTYTKVATITTETGMTSAEVTAWSFQRKTFYDGGDQVYWRFSYDGTEIDIEYNSSPWDSAWTSTTALGENTNDFSAWDDNTYVYAAYYDTYDIRIRRGTLSASSISWGTEYTALDGTGVSDTYQYAYITQDSSGFLWVVGRYYNGTNYYMRARKSSAANDPSSWGVTVYDLSSTSNTDANNYGSLSSLGSQDMYAVWIRATAIEGKKWTNGSSSWDVSATSIATGKSGLSSNFSMSSDTSNNLHLAYLDSGDDVYYKKYNGTSWDISATTIDSVGISTYTVVSVDTSNNDIYVLYLRSSTAYYNKYSGSWGGATDTNWTEGTSPAHLTSNYADSGLIFAEWTSGSASPYTLNWNYIIIPEKIWLFLGLGLVIPVWLRKMRMKRKFK